VRKLYNQHAATVVASDALGRVLRDWGVQNVRVLRLGVNAEIFHPDGSGTEAVRRSLGVSSDRNFLLYVGRLAKEKNIATLLRAFKTLQRRRPNEFHLLVIGDGPDRTQLRNLQLRTDNLSWIRYCADPCELAAFYRAADLFVHPGVQETFGLAALECQACGTPVVGIRGSYMDNVICHDQESWALENSVDALVNAIEDCSDRKLSVMGRNAARVARSLYSWPRVFDELFCIYRELRSKYRRFYMLNDDHQPFLIRGYRVSDREAVRKLCCDTGFLGEPIDPVYQDRELFSDFLTTYYTDHEPESCFLLEVDGQISGYLLGSRKPLQNQLYALYQNVWLFFRALTRYFRYNQRSRRFIRWILMYGWREVPAQPRRVPHFHINLLPEARKVSTTRSLMSAYLSYLYRSGEKRVCGQIITFESRRGEKMFERYGFKVLNRAEITKYK